MVILFIYFIQKTEYNWNILAAPTFYIHTLLDSQPTMLLLENIG